MTHFLDDDDGYFAWLAAHPDGFVLNCDRNPSAGYLVLHRSACHHIERWAGHRSTVLYGKVCAPDERALIDWAARLDGTPERCRTLRP